jgi:hypothetical protein
MMDKPDEDGNIWLSEGSKARVEGYKSTYEKVHGKEKDPLKEPFDIAVAMIPGQGLKNGRLWIGDGCVDTSSVSLSKIHHTKPDVHIETCP